jgi:hypothetical protein
MSSSPEPETRECDLGQLFTGTAKLSELDEYIRRAAELAGDGNDIILTGRAPVWLYLAVAHGLHGRARKLTYRSPVTGDVVIFDHNPF